MDFLPVVFKREGKTILAVFPTIPGTDAYDCTCYAHVGQHGSTDISYAAALKPAKPDEYRDLLRELSGIYEQGEEPVKLVIRRKIGTQFHLAARKRAMS